VLDVAIWHNRDFALLLGGTTVNEIGDWLLELALPVYVFIETGSGISTAAVYIVRLVVEVLCGPLGGSLADRWRLRATLVGTNLLQAAALGPLLLVSSDRIWPVYLVVALQGMISSVNDPAGFALLPRLVVGDQLVSANSAMSAGGSVARLIGAAAGGIAVTAGGLSAVAIADAATFLIGALAAGLMSAAANRSPIAGESSSSGDSSIRAGLDEVRSRPTVAALIWIQGLAMLGFGAFPVLFIVFVTDYLDGGGTEVGLIRASSALGGLIAAVVIGGVASKHHPAHVMAGGTWCSESSRSCS
jgi:MFS family permease